MLGEPRSGKETRESALASPPSRVGQLFSHPFARRAPSALGRVAFWGFLVGGLGGLGGTIALAISLGAPSRDIVITTICGLAGAAILATRFRWAPPVAALLGAYLLYLVFTEPFVVESLANPKGPNGGFGHFAGDVIACACALLAFGGSLAAAIQDYRQATHGGDRRAPRWLQAGLSLVAGMALGALLIGAVAAPPTPVGTTYTNGVPTIHLSAGNFDQNTVTIARGQKLLLVDDTASVHILDNGSWQGRTARPAREPGAPLVKDVRLSGDSAAIGPFATPGTYHIYCVVHPGMNLTINVQ